ncbi:cold shock domain-containing protein [Acinetobacter sp. ANC 4648]|uniref:cold shock domain-containing protein n=1 Tax=Acinetobacter sp. ANC 4648 TaxID=1977875 RepID=UPI000A3500FB|nr:cold shock domain-containing protein [Acinetobacter sp. ANC 4648]OTG83864.1 hypothetical protein B9T27_05035 [Acinetobacter sp. ANC 4648]
MYNFGSVKKYQSEKGFGFITHQDSGDDIFFHISDFPKHGGEPRINESLKFLIVEDNGKFKASQIVRIEISPPEPLKSHKIKKSQQLNNRNASSYSKLRYAILLLSLIAFMIALSFAWNQYQQYKIEQQIKVQTLMQQQQDIIVEQRKAVGELKSIPFSEKSKRALDTTRAAPIHTTTAMNIDTSDGSVNKKNVAQAEFSCDGRQHCGQMHSYEEALFFIRNCPNTKMDGNQDGIPCEKQFGR